MHARIAQKQDAVAYVMDTFLAVVTDLKDPEFQRVRQGVVDLYTYLYCPDAAACIWSAWPPRGS